MHGLIESSRASAAVGLLAVDAGTIARVAGKLGKGAERWIAASGFRGDAGSFCLLPDAQGHAQCVLAGISRVDDIFALAALPQKLPAGKYRMDPRGFSLDLDRVALGWGLAAYQFARYRKAAREPAQLVIDRATARVVLPRLEAIYRVRNLVNTPTQDMGPAELAAEIRQLAKAHGAKYRDWVGPQLLKANFPTIHAVGRASHREPRLIELTWGKARDPHLILVGKGVCFDTGGLDLKTSDGMRWMKKDMGGAAHAIALAGLIMHAKLPVRLSLLVPAVENAVAGNAYRPGEVIRTRAGITVEVDNTDAEGRLVLCDALAYAAEQKPDLIIDFSTLTGAARVALGPELPALFANRDDLAEAVLRSGQSEQDSLWRMPLWQPYAAMLESRIADMVNAGSSRQAGAITAALYLQRFVPETQAWMHVDQYAWNDADRPGRPHGGEAQGLRAFFAWLNQRYARRQDDADA
jgi:leucyl aminopeptidase